jgi:tetratricopeptide (TPR) repeat protein
MIAACLLALGLWSGGGEVPPARVLLAQSFDLPGGEAPAPAKTKPDGKATDQAGKKPPKKDLKSEDDLWSPEEDEASKEIPVEKPEGDAEDVEQAGDDKGEDKDAHKGGGWGAKAEQETWGDEAYQDKGEVRTDVPGGDGARKKADGGTPDGQPGVIRIPGLDGGLATVDAGSAGADGAPAAVAAPGAADGGTEPPIVAPPDNPPPEALEAIRPPSGTLADLGALWETRRLHLEQRDFELARLDLERFVRLKEELGLRNTPLHSLALVRESGRDAARGDAKAAGESFEVALRLSPDLADLHLAKAWRAFRDSPWALGAVAGPLVDAARASWRDPFVRNRWLANGLLSLLIGLGLAMIVYTLAELLRYVRLFLHDFHHLFPAGAARIQTGLLALILLLLPVFLRAGALPILLSWLALAWIYQGKTERALSLIVVALLAAAPLGFGLVVQGLERPRTELADVLAVERGPAPEASLQRLRMALEARPEDPVLLVTLAGHQKRSGDLGRARELLERAASVQPSSEVVLNNLGVVCFLQGDMPKALEHFQRVTMLRPDLVVGYFNISRAYFNAMQIDKGRAARQQAIQLDPDLTRELSQRAEGGAANRVLADLPVPDEWLVAPAGRLSPERMEKAELMLWRSYAGTGTPRVAWYWLGGALLVFGLLALARGRLFATHGCVRCGRPVCRRCEAELRDNSLCGQCFHAFVRKDKVDARVRISKEIQVRQHRARVETLARALSFVVPGVGQLLKDRPLRGMLILAVCSLCLVQAVFQPAVLRDPWDAAAGVDWLRLAPLALVFLAFYLWAVMDAFRSEG